MVENTEIPSHYRPNFRWYLPIGRALGAISGFVTFVGCWIYCISAYGFLLGGSLGWFPSGICAAIVGFLTMYLWGLLLVAAIIWLVSYSFWRSPTGPQSSLSPPTAESDAAAAAAEAASAANAAAADANAAIAQPPTPTVIPPPPSIGQAERAVRQYEQLFSGSGIAGVVTSTMDCYSRLTGSSSWSDWDFCAALDQLGENYDAQSQRNGTPPAEYFEQSATTRRQLQAATSIAYDPDRNHDRIAAMKTVVDQAIANVTAQTAAAVAVGAANETAKANLPSFDCDRVQKPNLKLVCSTPELAQADRQLAEAYRAALNRSQSPSAVRDSQRDWIRRRDATPADPAALAQLYESRTEELRAVSAQNSQ